MRLAILFSLTYAALPTHASVAESVKDILARMDHAAATFRGMSAHVQWVDHTAVLDDNTIQKGAVRMKLRKPHVAEALLEFTEPDQKSVALHDKLVEIFYPKVKLLQIYDVGKNAALLDEYLLLGFGTPGKELAKSYGVELAGAETVAGRECTKLVLAPKSKEVRKNLTKIEIWIPYTEAHPVQQRFHRPSGDYMQITYTEFQLNPPLPDAALKLKLPRGVKKEYPGKID